MKNYSVIEVEAVNTYPIIDCGGIVLAPGEKLVADSAILKRLQAQFGPTVFKETGTVQKEKLKNGYYEVHPRGMTSQHQHSESAAKEATHVLSPGVAEAPVMARAADKSMAAKNRTKRKY